MFLFKLYFFQIADVIEKHTDQCLILNVVKLAQFPLTIQSQNTSDKIFTSVVVYLIHSVAYLESPNGGGAKGVKLSHPLVYHTAM